MKLQLTHVVLDGQDLPIDLDTDRSRIEIRLGADEGVLVFERSGGILSLMHTEVPAAMRGKRIGELLARAALDYARQEGLRVRPYCAYVAAFIQRHDEYASLVDPQFAP